jgi:hypothetical protein
VPPAAEANNSGRASLCRSGPRSSSTLVLIGDRTKATSIARSRRDLPQLIDSQTRVIAIEIKADSAPGESAAGHLAWLRDELGERFVAGVCCTWAIEATRSTSASAPRPSARSGHGDRVSGRGDPVRAVLEASIRGNPTSALHCVLSRRPRGATRRRNHSGAAWKMGFSMFICHGKV